jgi:hypothetical protein
MDEYEDSATEEGNKAPTSAGPYCQALKDAEKAFQVYQDKVTSIEKLYANLSKMAEAAGDREFQIFWANLEVLKPTIYTRPPQPVVQPRQRGGKNMLLPKELGRAAAEILERALEYDVEADDLHDTLIQVRDDLAIGARGVPWVLDNGQCIHVDREDFLHEPARKWSEVGWVARRAYLTKDELKARFKDIDLPKVKFDKLKSEDDGIGNDYATTGKKAQVWEMWHKAEGKVCWVMHDYPDVLDEQPPLIDVKGFFPCPRPAYGTLERRTLKPVPDFVYYRDQVDEINELTARISSLSESLRLKGFYASGVSEVGEAIEAAMKSTDNTAVLVPVSNFAALGGQALKDAVVWLPIRDVADTIVACVELRRQLIEDVYQITGISDIMRGETEASETATAQNIKAQYGSVRVRERQMEMVRVARDVIRLKAEIMAETVPAQEIALIAQIKIPTNAEVMQQMQMARQQAMQSGQPPQEPDMSKVVTIEQVDALLKDQKLRPFVLDVESDSTIAPNEEAEKASRIEFITAVGGFIQQAGPMVQMQPETAPFVAEMMKFAAASFRGGRELMGSVDEFAAQISAKGQQMANQPPQPDPMVQAKQAELELKREEMGAKVQGEQAKMQVDVQAKQAELQMKQQEAHQRLQLEAQKLEIERERMGIEREKMGMERERIMLDAQTREREFQERGVDREAAKEQAHVKAGIPVGYSFDDDRAQFKALMERMNKSDEFLSQTMQAIAQSQAALAQVVAQMGQSITAPKEIIRDAQGRPVGVRTVN